MIIGPQSVGWDVGIEWAGLPPLDGDLTADACVVGLGASGLAAVEELADRGLSVVGVDAGRVAAGAAGRNAGFLLGGPAPFLHEAIARWGEQPAVGLYRETLNELARLRDVLGQEVVRPVGSIRLAGLPGDPADQAEVDDRAREAADCAAHATALRRYGIAVEDYDGPLGSGIFLPDDAAMNPAVRALELARRASGRARLFERTRVDSVRAGEVATERGTVTAGVVIVAVDGRLDVLLPALAGRVRTARLQMLCTGPSVACLPCPVYGRWGYDFAQQTPDGRLFVGGGRDRFLESEWTTDATPTPQVQGYLDALVSRFGGTGARAAHRWAASVGFTADGRPLCAEVERRVVAVGGYSGTGNLVGPVAARAAVALAVDEVAPPAWCSPIP